MTDEQKAEVLNAISAYHRILSREMKTLIKPENKAKMAVRLGILEEGYLALSGEIMPEWRDTRGARTLP